MTPYRYIRFWKILHCYRNSERSVGCMRRRKSYCACVLQFIAIYFHYHIVYLFLIWNSYTNCWIENISLEHNIRDKIITLCSDQKKTTTTKSTIKKKLKKATTKNHDLKMFLHVELKMIKVNSHYLL